MNNVLQHHPGPDSLQEIAGGLSNLGYINKLKTAPGMSTLLKNIKPGKLHIHHAFHTLTNYPIVVLIKLIRLSGLVAHKKEANSKL